MFAARGMPSWPLHNGYHVNSNFANFANQPAFAKMKSCEHLLSYNYCKQPDSRSR